MSKRFRKQSTRRPPQGATVREVGLLVRLPGASRCPADLALDFSRALTDALAKAAIPFVNAASIAVVVECHEETASGQAEFRLFGPESAVIDHAGLIDALRGTLATTMLEVLARRNATAN